MDLWVLGANGTYPTAGRPTAGYLVTHEDTRLWLEAGTGTLLALQELIDPSELSALVVSHRHADHVSDIFALSHYLRFGSLPPDPLPVFVPTGLADLLVAFAGPDFAAPFSFETPAAGEEVTIGSIELRFGHADHTVPTLQVRLAAGGRSLAYSADTGTGSGLIELASGCNTLLAEASFQGTDKPAAHHLTAAEAGGIAQAAGVERLILTHLMPSLDPRQSIEEAAARFDGDVMAAAPGLEVLI